MSKRRSYGRPGFCLFPGYKWCGPGCSGPGAPVDAVDAACKAHDECYQKFGPSCMCDAQFMRQLERLMIPATQEGRNAKVMYDYLKLYMLFKC